MTTAMAPTPLTRMELTFQRDLPGFRGARHFRVEPLVEGDDAIFARLICTDDVHLKGGETVSNLSLLVMSPAFVWPDYEVEINETVRGDLALKGADDVAVLAIVHPHDPLSESTANLYSPIVVNLASGAADQVVPATSEDEVGWSVRTPFPFEKGESPC